MWLSLHGVRPQATLPNSQSRVPRSDTMHKASEKAIVTSNDASRAGSAEAEPVLARCAIPQSIKPSTSFASTKRPGLKIADEHASLLGEVTPCGRLVHSGSPAISKKREVRLVIRTHDLCQLLRNRGLREWAIRAQERRGKIESCARGSIALDSRS